MEFITHRAMGPIDNVMLQKSQLKNLYVVLHV